MPRKIKDGTKWGNWHLEASNLTLALQTAENKYKIDLESVTDSAEMLDWIFQLRMKVWVTNDIIGDLASAFRDLFNPQATICSGGHNRTINAKEHLESVLEKR